MFSRNDPQAETEITSVHPNRLSASMLARYGTVVGECTCPRPWRGRKAICTPSSVPVRIASDGLPHGPQPGKTEESIGMKATNELAVMVDTFAPLRVSERALDCEDPDYPRSWLT